MELLIGCINDNKINKFSKYLSYLLRHNPSDLDLEMNLQGWVSVPELIIGLENSGKYLIDVHTLEQVVESDEKGRYSLSEDKRFIRANQGHSIEGLKLDWKDYHPTGNVYHGTATRFLDSILEQGIKSMSRQYVHLSKDLETAEKVGSRHGEPVILEVDASGMSRDGFKFYESDNGVVLVDIVPAKYITVKS